jgi:hypothetical protein
VAKSKKNARIVRLRPNVNGSMIDDAEARQERTEEFRSWLRNVVESSGKSLHAIEVNAGIRGNALGKFLRGERGQRHSLTPLMIGRLAPVISVGEEEMLVRAGHLTFDPGDPPIEAAILADRALDTQAKALLLGLLGRLRAPQGARL